MSKKVLLLTIDLLISTGNSLRLLNINSLLFQRNSKLVLPQKSSNKLINPLFSWENSFSFKNKYWIIYYSWVSANELFIYWFFIFQNLTYFYISFWTNDAFYRSVSTLLNQNLVFKILNYLRPNNLIKKKFLKNNFVSLIKIRSFLKVLYTISQLLRVLTYILDTNCVSTFRSFSIHTFSLHIYRFFLYFKMHFEIMTFPELQSIWNKQIHKFSIFFTHHYNFVTKFDQYLVVMVELCVKYSIILKNNQKILIHA